jgi:threonine/homoserine/homoserine lactone efflux protein
MPKALCITGMVVAILVLILFLIDLLAPASLAPFKKANWLMDVVFVLCAAVLGYMSWTTLKEQS